MSTNLGTMNQVYWMVLGLALAAIATAEAGQLGCLMVEHGTRQSPNFVRPAEGAPRFMSNPLTAQLTSYQFSCSGTITEWRVIIDSDHDNLIMEFYVIRFRTDEEGRGYFSTVGINAFPPGSSGSSFDPDTKIFTGIPPLNNRIQVQAGDQLSIYFESTIGTTEGIYFAADADNDLPFTRERVLSQTGTTQVNGRPGVLLNLSTNRAPLISVGIDCPEECNQLPLSTPAFSSAQISTEHEQSTSMPGSDITITMNMVEVASPVLSMLTTTTMAPTTTLPPGPTSDNSGMSLAIAGAIALIVAGFIIGIVVGGLVINQSKRNRQNKNQDTRRIEESQNNATITQRYITSSESRRAHELHVIGHNEASGYVNVELGPNNIILSRNQSYEKIYTDITPVNNMAYNQNTEALLHTNTLETQRRNENNQSNGTEKYSINPNDSYSQSEVFDDQEYALPKTSPDYEVIAKRNPSYAETICSEENEVYENEVLVSPRETTLNESYNRADAGIALGENTAYEEMSPLAGLTPHATTEITLRGNSAYGEAGHVTITRNESYDLLPVEDQNSSDEMEEQLEYDYVQ